MREKGRICTSTLTACNPSAGYKYGYAYDCPTTGFVCGKKL